MAVEPASPRHCECEEIITFKPDERLDQSLCVLNRSPIYLTCLLSQRSYSVSAFSALVRCFRIFVFGPSILQLSPSVNVYCDDYHHSVSTSIQCL